MINGIHSVLNTVMDWAIKNTIQEVLVLDGIPVQDIPRSERQTIILESNEMDQIMRNGETNENNISISYLHVCHIKFHVQRFLFLL